MSITEDAWLSERFGHPVFTLDCSAPAATLLPALEDHRGGQSRASYQAKVPAEQVELAAALSRAGFDVVSTALTLSREPQSMPAADDRIREARPDDEQALAAIAEAGFTRDRFHLDPAIPDEVANKIKRDWIANCVNGVRGDGVLVACVEERPVGLLAALRSEADGRSARIIDLMVVSTEARGTGIGRALAERFLSESAATSDVVAVGTQAANPAAIRFYEGIGFAAERAAYDMHMHVGDPWDRG